MPKIKLIYYKYILDICMQRFFEDYSDCFSRDESGKYQFSAPMRSIEKYFIAAIKTELVKRINAFDILQPEYTFIIGGCDPAENIVLEYKSGYFPEKLNRLISNGRGLKYILMENDILIDMREFNRIFDNIFIRIFKNGTKTILGEKYFNVFAIRHRRLDCYAVFKILKYIYGKANCVNIWKDEGCAKSRCLAAINDFINKYVNNKIAINKSSEFKQIVSEIKQYTEEKIQGALHVRYR